MLLWVDSMVFFGLFLRFSKWLLIHYYAVSRALLGCYVVSKVLLYSC